MKGLEPVEGSLKARSRIQDEWSENSGGRNEAKALGKEDIELELTMSLSSFFVVG